MRRRGTAFVVALVMLFSTIPTRVFASEMTEFSDMPNDWSKPALERAVENGLLKGDNGKIRANDYLTRAEMATIVNRGFNAADKASLNNFKDVAGDDWFYEEMQKAVQMKTFEGSGNRLNPRNNITREEAFVVLARAFKLSDEFGYELNSFNDSDMISSWAKDEVAALVSEGYVAGSGGKINPKKNITRAEFAQIMHNLVKTYINEEGEYTEDYQGNVMINRRNAILKGSTISGDLIIGDGVGDGDVTLDDVTVTGRLIVRGGGEDSIIIKGDSDIRSITIVKVKGSVRVYSQDGANIGTVVVDGTDNVVLEGKFNNVTVLAKDTNVLAKNANIQSVTVDGDDSRLTIGSDSDVKTLNLNGAGTKTEISGKVGNIEVAKRAEGATVTVEKNGKVDTIAANSEGTKITGSGEVKDVKANANNIEVKTKDTKVSAGEGTTGVKAGEKDVAAGKSETTKTDSDSGSSSSSGGGGGGGGSRPTASAFWSDIWTKAYTGNVKEGIEDLASVSRSVDNLTVTFNDSNEREQVKKVLNAADALFAELNNKTNSGEITIKGSTYKLGNGNMARDIATKILGDMTDREFSESTGSIRTSYTAKVVGKDDKTYNFSGTLTFKME